MSVSISPRTCDVVCCVVWCVVVVVVLLVVVVCVFGVCVCVCLCVLRHAEKCGKRLRVYTQNVLVYAGTTSTCVSTCARGASTHGNVLNPHTGARVIVSSAYQNFAHVVWILPIFQFENRSRATRCRFLESFALPDKAVQFQQS